MAGEFFKDPVWAKRFALALALLLLSGLFGALLGHLTAPQIVPRQVLIAEREARQAEERAWVEQEKEQTSGITESETETDEVAPKEGVSGDIKLLPPPNIDVPVYYHVGVEDVEQWEHVAEGVVLAHDAGVRRFFLPVHFDWKEDNAPLPVAPVLGKLLETSPEAKFVLHLDLNPNAAWLQEHPEDVVQYGGERARYPSPASPIWRLMVERGLNALAKEVRDSGYAAQWEGVVIAAMDEGFWRFTSQFDRSPVNSRAFLDWLVREYENIEFLEAKWQITIGAITSISIPPEPESGNTRQVFLPLPNAHRQADYLRYSSYIVADTIRRFARHFKEATQGRVKVYAPYGFNLEVTHNAAGHFSQEMLLDGPLDGIVGPVSYAGRGLGGTGGMMGTIHSAQTRGKNWIIVDDTRTGLQRDPHTGEVSRMEGLRADDVRHLQQRNFAMALLNGMGLVWSDPRAEGRFINEDQWVLFRQMREEYQRFAGEGVSPEAPGVMVVVDDNSRFYQQCDVLLNERLLLQARDAVLMSGVNAQFCLLDDVLYGMAPTAPVYLFLNAFVLSPDEREILHGHLAQNGASAIWMYAPGFINGAARVENIAALVGMDVKQFDGGARAGSIYRISGPWLEQDEPFGESIVWGPLFYVEDEEADTLATYQDTEKSSIAMRLQESGWTSVYIADPHLNADLFREIMRILEQPVYFRPGSEKTNSVMYAHPRYVAVHAAKPGEKTVDFGRLVEDVTDVFDPEAGWQQRRSVTLPMKVGETKVLRLR